MASHNAVGWFEIPVVDMERAIRFYEAVFDVELERHDMGELDMAWFPFSEGLGAPGSLVKHETYYRPTKDGVVVYFTAHSGDLRNELSKVEQTGGTIIVDRKKISDEHGYMAWIEDSEGNRIAIHSRN